MITYADAYSHALRRLGEAAHSARPDGEVVKAFHDTFDAAWRCLVHSLHFSVLDELGDANSTIYAAYVDALITDEEGWRAMFFDSGISLRPLDTEAAATLAARVRERHCPLLEAFEQALLKRIYA